MPNVDQWLADAAQIARRDPPTIKSDVVLERIAVVASPTMSLPNHDMRWVMACAAAAALLGGVGFDVVFAQKVETSSATWISSPSAISPSRLLMGP